MSIKLYHINKRGEAVLCRSTRKPCAISSLHFENKEAAQRAYRVSKESFHMPKLKTVKKDKKFKTIPKGETFYRNAVLALSEGFYKDVDGIIKSKKCAVVVPDVNKLTAQKRVKIAHLAWIAAGNSEEAWERSSNKDKLAFSKKYLTKYSYLKIINHGGVISCETNEENVGEYLIKDLMLAKMD